MRIGIDARFFGPKDKGPGRYTENLIRNLEKLDIKNQYFIFLRKDNFDEYQPQNPNFKKVLANYKWYGWKEQLFFPFKLKKYKLDLMHFTHFNAPIFYRGKFIITIHDLILRHFPTSRKNLRNFLFYPFKQLMYRLAFGQVVKRAKKIIAVSRYTKKDILKYYNINPEKIEVIYEGVFQHKDVRNPQKYILYVGNVYPHKNLENLILAFRKIKQDNFNLQLVLVGGNDYFYKKLKKNNDDVIFTGFIKDEDLNILYNNAALYVFPSLYEGFGLPPLEAMARGLAVVSSNATCLPEILGDAALYFNPLDIDDIAEKIKKVLADNNLREQLIQKGFAQVKKYSWKKMAEETLKLY
jgi:glycosyltransferase involved in cell wall biosynthesis